MTAGVGYGIRSLIALAVALASLGTASACNCTSGRNPGMTSLDFSSDQTRVPGEYIVTLVSEADKKVIDDLYGSFGIKNIQDLGSNIFLIILTEDPGPAKMEELRGQNAHVKAIQPNFIYRTNGPRNSQ